MKKNSKLQIYAGFEACKGLIAWCLNTVLKDRVVTRCGFCSYFRSYLKGHFFYLLVENKREYFFK